MIKNSFLVLIIIISIKVDQIAAGSIAPVWLPNEYFQTQPAYVKTNVLTTFNQTNPITITIPFKKTYTQIPQLAFGIKNYKGSDPMRGQNFAINIIARTLSGFTLFTMINGPTNMRILTLYYMTVDKSYPYQLSIFNNIEANYLNGPLSNISLSNVGTRIYTNTMNFTDLAGTIGSNYTLFGSNLAKNIVAPYLCAIYINGTDNYLIKFLVTTNILNTQQFQIIVTVLPGFRITLLKFSLVIVNVYQVQSAGFFTIMYQSIYLDATIANYITIPHQFVDGTFIGMLDYTTLDARNGLEFNWEFDLPNDRVIVQPSVLYPGQSSARGGLTGYTVVVFYVKTWDCLVPYYYFNLDTDMCDDYCAKYFYANQSASSCVPCKFSCSACINGPLLDCTSCDNITDKRQLVNGNCQCLSGTYSDPAQGTTICIPCQSKVSNCAVCQISNSNQFKCLSCAVGFTLNNGNCISCLTLTANCLTATSTLDMCACTSCNPASGFVLQDSTTCALCSNYIPYCQKCISQSTCTLCDATGGIFLDLSSQCSVCSNYMPNCLQCTSSSVCTLCDETARFFVNPTSFLCQVCAQVGCSSCATLTTCSTCDNSVLYFLDTTTNKCYFCDPSQNYFPAGAVCQKCALTQCLTCSSLTACTACNQVAKYYLNTTTNICETCKLSGCLQCLSLSTCLTCDKQNNYHRVSNGTCQQCPFTCLCDGYSMPKAIVNSIEYCSTTCGDGLVRNFQQCDDGNIINGDGCSSTCTIQKTWTCDSNPSYSCCTLNSNKISIVVNKINKPSGKNSIQIELEITPNIPILTSKNLLSFVTLTVVGVPVFNERKSVIGNQQLSVLYDYNQSIQGKNCSISLSLYFSQAGAPSCIISATKTINILTKAGNNVPFMFYDNDTLAKQEQAKNSINTMEIIVYVIFFASMVPCKIIGLELIGVMQLAYFTLAQQKDVNALLQPFMQMSGINGPNFNMINESNGQTPDAISSIGYNSLFLNNCNAMLLLIVAEMTVAAVIYGLSHLLKNVSEKFSTVAKYLIKEGLITLIMFNAFNIAFGVGVHFQYADRSNPSYGVSSLAAVFSAGLMFTACLLLMVADAKQFGQFKDKLKPNLLCQSYFVISLAYRFALGYYAAVQSQYTLSSLVIIGFSFLFISYNLTNLPFTDALHNYRANVCHISQLVILFVTNYYSSMTSSTPIQEKAYLFSAAQLQIAALYTSIGVSVGCLGVQVFKLVKAKISSFSNAQTSLNNETSLNAIHNTQNNIPLQQNNFSNMMQI